MTAKDDIIIRLNIVANYSITFYPMDYHSEKFMKLSKIIIYCLYYNFNFILDQVKIVAESKP